MSPENEAKLLNRCLEGDSQAWDELLDLHYGPVGRFVFQLAPDLSQEDVEEICQETFLKVVKHLPAFQRNCRFQTWVFRIAVNKAKDFRERQRAVKRGGGQVTVSLQAEDPETGLTLNPASDMPTPDEAMVSAEQCALLRQCLDRLGEPCRELIELRYFGGLSYEELSDGLGLNKKTVSSRLSKCLDRLEKLMRSSLNREKVTPYSV